MDLEMLEKKLLGLGYDREDSCFSETNNKSVIGEDFTGKNINGTILLNCKIRETIFDNAAATGSLFKKCEFFNCSMTQGDFEFCNFMDCEIESKNTIICSFNNGNFIETKFKNSTFEFCTFTGAYFDNCVFENVIIKNSTLENALFHHCTFIGMDLRNLNMEYVHLNAPLMNNVTLPFAQIPYMFGCLAYIMETRDSIQISSQNGGSITKKEYIDDAIPLLIEYWQQRICLNNEDFYFPLANIYIAQRNYSKAITVLREGLQTSVINKDFRLIKFYCKLISSGNMFKVNTLYKFYHLINRFGSQSDIENTEMRSFMRNIGEIKAILFSSIRKPTLTISFRTNLRSEQTDKVGFLLGKLFAITKMKNCIEPNNVELNLSENSPLLVSAKISGKLEYILLLLPALLHIAGITKKQAEAFKLIPTNGDLVPRKNATLLEADRILAQCKDHDIECFLAEYSLEHCNGYLPHDAVTYFCNHWQDAGIWDGPITLLDE